MTVDAIARTDVVTVERDANATDIARTMTDQNVGSVVVVEDDRPVGIVTDRDLAVEVLGTGVDPEDVRADELGAETVVTVDPDARVYTLVRTMGEQSVRRIPVVDEEGRLLGIVTMDDVLGLLGMELDHLTNVIQAESPMFESLDTNPLVDR